MEKRNVKFIEFPNAENKFNWKSVCKDQFYLRDSDFPECKVTEVAAKIIGTEIKGKLISSVR